MSPKFELTYKSPFGVIGVNTLDNKILELRFCRAQKIIQPKNKFLKEVKRQLSLYFKKKLKKFELPYLLLGTEYQKKILNEVSKIKYGNTKTYSDIALKFFSHPRPVGNACRNNPIQLIIPCHRVVGKNNIGGYYGESVNNGGKMIYVKKNLLEIEKKI